MELPIRKRTRLEKWDYSSPATYFLTICAKDRRPFFSRVVDCGITESAKVSLLPCGREIQNAIAFFAENNTDLRFDAWVIMPNHIHILLTLKQSPGGASGMMRPTSQVIPKFVSSLKRFTNRKCGRELWQNGYYDHIIRDEQDFLRIWQYIDTNPARWLEDKYYVIETMEVNL
ncbi:MAG: transposase [Faecousia sp.]